MRPDNNTNISNECSCIKCDSFSCFALRHKRRFNCNTFKGSCFIAPRNCKTSVNKVYSATMQPKKCCKNEVIEKEVTYDCALNDYVAVLKSPSERSTNTNASKEKSQGGSKIDLNEVLNNTRNFLDVCGFVDSTTGKLSAQVMDLPYNDFKETLSYTKSEENKIVKFDLLCRIKEIYKACSCKICECVNRLTTVGNDQCQCKPCDCKDCAKVNKFISNEANQDNDGCPCIRCDRKECKGIVKKNAVEPQYCDCVWQDCLEISNIIAEPCDCMPCECIQCKSTRKNTKPIVVARIAEDTTNHCSCTPCNCTQCAQNLQAESNQTNEISTGLSRPPNCMCDTCENEDCEVNSNGRCICHVQKHLTRKPIEKHTYDYDIRRSTVRKRDKDSLETSTSNKNSILEEYIKVDKKIYRNKLVASNKSLFNEKDNTISENNKFVWQNKYVEEKFKDLDGCTIEKRRKCTDKKNTDQNKTKECLSYTIAQKAPKYETCADNKKICSHKNNEDAKTEECPTNNMFCFEVIEQVSKVRCVGLELEKSLKDANNRLSKMYCKPLQYLAKHIKECEECCRIKYVDSCVNFDPHRFNLDNLYNSLQKSKILTLELIKILKQFEEANHPPLQREKK